MKFGSVKQKASPILVFFVFGCSIITIVLLWSMNKAIARAQNYYPDDLYEPYIKN